MTNPVLDWFTGALGWSPFAFQREAWAAFAAGRSGLVNAPTGMGKTYALWLGPLMRWVALHPDPAAWPERAAEPLRVLWITPLRALAADTTQTLARPVRELGLPWSVELRTGDVSSSVKARQKRRLPSTLVTTPESLSLLLSYADAPERFRGLWCVVVDEWHELIATKRGTQTELCLARLRTLNPDVQTWGLSATLANLEEARDALLGVKSCELRIDELRVEDRPIADSTPAASSTHNSKLITRHSPPPALIIAQATKRTVIDTIIPADVQRFPWAGHLGLNLLEPVLERLAEARSTLLFTNTRSQCEMWFRGLNAARPEWIGEIAIHHGSIDRKVRQQVEDLVRAGRLRCVVCTSSLDLGVDFSPVDAVIQVGSPKGVARLMQRAGRSGHQPGGVSRLVGVPTHAWELVEFAAARAAVGAGRIEARQPLDRPLDVLVQHLVTVAAGGGFDADEMLREVRTAWSYRDLTQEEWSWCLDFVGRGGAALTAYPQYARVVEEHGRLTVASQRIARMHRLGIGTITSNTSIAVKYVRGKTLGTVEESFLGRLAPGDRFVFAGQMLELVRVHGMAAYVRKARGKKSAVPSWQGSKMPLSTQLADAVRDQLDAARLGRFESPEMRAVRPLLDLQASLSRIPAPDDLLFELVRTRDGHHLFVFPFAGRLVHEGLGALAAYRLSQKAPRTITVTVNDYGLELLCAEPLELDEGEWRDVLSRERLLEDLLATLRDTELTRRQFRDIARVAGLIVTGYPGERQSSRQLQASAELFFEVFREFDPGNLLLDQARREVLQQQLELGRLSEAMMRIEAMRLVRVDLDDGRLTPMAFPLWAEHLREQHVSSEKWEDRVRRMSVALEKGVGGMG